MSAVWARNWYGWSWSLLERRRDPLGRLVEVMGVLVVERGGHVLPVVVERRREVLLAGDDHGGVGRREAARAARGRWSAGRCGRLPGPRAPILVSCSEILS